jgi:aspartyl/asparaginyl beta-hydroxylase (cupin superfamily)
VTEVPIRPHADAAGRSRRASRVAATRAFFRLLLGHLRRYRTAQLQDVATATLRDPSAAWVVPALNATIRLRQILTRTCYLRPRHAISRATFQMRHRRDPPAAQQRQLSLLCPTRGRVQGLATLLRSVARTTRAAHRIEVLCYVDADDPALPGYRRLAHEAENRLGFGRLVLAVGEPVGVPGAWNALAARATGDYLLMANDDQFYVDHGWDAILDRRLDALAAQCPDEVLCLYFDAGQYPEGGCDFPIISRAWYETLGYYVPEIFQQWQAERWIFDLARRIDRLYPVAGVLVEHLHYQDYKAPFDTTYQRHRMTREKSFADQAMFIRTAADRTRAAARLRTTIETRTPTPHPDAGHMQKETGAMADSAVRAADNSGTRQYILQTARRYYGNLIDAWHYGGRTEDAWACAELAVKQGVWAHPMQRAREYVPGLDARPLHEPAQFWFIASLEEHYPQIRAEIEHVLDSTVDPVRPTTDDAALIRRGSWKQAHLYRDGRWQEDVCAHFPVTRSILAEIPEVSTFNPGVVTVSRVAPGSHIMPHCGPTNAVLRVHLPITIPAGVTIRVADEWMTWEEGKCLVFDDSFEHEVRHEGTEDRVVLILDTLHPDLGGDQRDRLLQRRLTTEEQIIAFMREGGLERVDLDGGEIVLHPDATLRELVERYMVATGIDGVELRGDEVVWHRGAGA